jgi:hypothetical protein
MNEWTEGKLGCPEIPGARINVWQQGRVDPHTLMDQFNLEAMVLRCFDGHER